MADVTVPGPLAGRVPAGRLPRDDVLVEQGDVLPNHGSCTSADFRGPRTVARGPGADAR